VNESERVVFHPDFERALAFATRLHARQVRKGTDIPYISHLLAVASLVLEYGGGPDEAIAGLLHDAIEDCPKDYPGEVAALRRDIESEFGHAVLEIVEGCTDTDSVRKPPWRERKERYIAHVREASASVHLVSCADKLHNSRSIVADLRVHGDALFARFKGGREGTLWYYTALATVFTELGPRELAAELQRTVNTMNTLAA
jgi:GTP pyrophosphokinase